MPPKRTKAVKEPDTDQPASISSETNASTSVKKNKASEKPGSEEASKAAEVRKVPTHPPTLEMVKEALKSQSSRKGSSVQSIRGYILEKYPSVDAVKLKYMLRKALLKGLDNGVLARPANSSTTGAQGRFLLRAKPKKAKVGLENPDSEKAIVKKAKPKDAAKPAAKKVKTASSEAADSKLPPAKKPKPKKPTDAASQHVEKPVKAQSSKAGVKDGATAVKNAGKRGKKTTE